MTEISNSTMADLVKHWELLGPPAVLSSESLNDYNAMRDQLLACMRPDDFVVLVFVRDFLDTTWEVLRFDRHKALVPERRFRKRLEYQQTHNNTIVRQAALVKTSDQLEAQTARVGELRNVFESTSEDLKSIMQQQPNEYDHALGLEYGIKYYESLADLQQVAARRRGDALQYIRQYRESLAEHLQKVTSSIHTAKVDNTDAVNAAETPLVPTEQAP